MSQLFPSRNLDILVGLISYFYVKIHKCALNNFHQLIKVKLKGPFKGRSLMGNETKPLEARSTVV